MTDFSFLVDPCFCSQTCSSYCRRDGSPVAQRHRSEKFMHCSPKECLLSLNKKKLGFLLQKQPTKKWWTIRIWGWPSYYPWSCSCINSLSNFVFLFCCSSCSPPILLLCIPKSALKLYLAGGKGLVLHGDSAVRSQHGDAQLLLSVQGLLVPLLHLHRLKGWDHRHLELQTKA